MSAHASRPRFTDARKPRPSRPWSLNGITMTTCHPPTCACHQAACRPSPQIKQEPLIKKPLQQGNQKFLSRSGRFYWLSLLHATGCVGPPRPWPLICGATRKGWSEGTGVRSLRKFSLSSSGGICPVKAEPGRPVTSLAPSGVTARAMRRHANHWALEYAATK